MNYKRELAKIEGEDLVSLYADKLDLMDRTQLINLIWKYALQNALRADVV